MTRDIAIAVIIGIFALVFAVFLITSHRRTLADVQQLQSISDFPDGSCAGWAADGKHLVPVPCPAPNGMNGMEP